MQWLVLIWSIFVLAIYIGGFFVPALGAHTIDSSKIYAAFLLIGVAATALRWLNGSRTNQNAPGSPDR